MKTVLISGADRNIGLEMTKNFLGRGWKVYAGRFREDLLWLDELKKDYPESLVIVPMDVSDDESVKAAVRMVAEQEEYLDMLVHNAAHFGGAVDDYDGYMIPFNISESIIAYVINKIHYLPKVNTTLGNSYAFLTSILPLLLNQRI